LRGNADGLVHPNGDDTVVLLAQDISDLHGDSS